MIATMRGIVSRRTFAYVDNLTGELVSASDVREAEQLAERSEREEVEGHEPGVLLLVRDERTINPVLVDIFSASIFVQVHDALKPANRAKLLDMTVSAAMDVVLRVVERARSGPPPA